MANVNVVFLILTSISLLTAHTVDPSQCDYYHPDTVVINNSSNFEQQIDISLTSIEIHFDIKLNGICADEQQFCNIFSILSDAYNTLYWAALNINNNYTMELFTYYRKFTITNFQPAITDNVYHIGINLTPYSVLLTINYQIHEFQLYNTNHHLHTTHITALFYVSDKKTVKTHLINASVSDICIISSKNVTDIFFESLECGEPISGKIQLDSDLNSYYSLELVEPKIVIFSLNSSTEISIAINLFNEELFKVQPIVLNYSNGFNLMPGKYILALIDPNLIDKGVNNYETWHINVLCYQQIKCGEPIGIHDRGSQYFFATTHTLTVLFELYGLIGQPFSFNLTNLDTGNKYKSSESQLLTELLIHSLSVGNYILDIHCVERFNLDIFCVGTLHIHCYSERFNTSYVAIYDKTITSWLNAALQCERLYGTSLATIKTKNDSLELYRSRAVLLENVNLFIGLYQESDTYKWVDGSTCSDNNISFGMNHCDEKNCGSFLMSVLKSNYNQPKYGLVSPWYNAPSQINVNGMLCNAPNSKYSPNNCNNTVNCWKEIECCNNSILLSDISDYKWKSPLIIWNSTLYIVGKTQIHYTKMDLNLFEFNMKSKWNHTHYNYTPRCAGMISHQGYTHYESWLYLHIKCLHDDHILLRFNLQFLNTSVINISYQIDVENICLVADLNHVYIISSIGMIYTLNLANGNWTGERSFISTTVGACSLGTHDKSIYIFHVHEDSLYKYNINEKTLDVLQTLNLCYSQQGRALKRSGKIFLQGCYVQSWNTLIYDLETDTFEPYQIGISNPNSKYIPYYRNAQLASFDDNILLLFHSTHNIYPRVYSANKSDSIKFYYAVTDLISINFKETGNVKGIWLSDGFTINYFVNDFSGVSNNYTICIYSDSLSYAIINECITLNTWYDQCTCISYKCYNCSHQFNLSKHLFPTNQYVEQLKLLFKPDSSEYNITMVKYHSINITIYTCNISFTPVPVDINPTHRQKTITFAFDITNNCYERVGRQFSVQINASKLNIDKTLIIFIQNSNDTTCKLCESKHIQQCKSCSNQFEIQFDSYSDNDPRFQVDFKPKTIDLHIDSDDTYSAVYTPPLSAGIIAAIIIGGCILVFFIVAISLYLQKIKQKNKRLEKEKTLQEEERAKHTIPVTNMMVISINIGKYMDRKKIDEFEIETTVKCDDLDGVQRDYANIKALCDELNYDIYPSYEKYEWTENEIVTFLKERAEDFGKNNGKNYDSMLMVMSCHGLENNIITSDYHVVEKNAIHRLFTTNYPSARNLPRIFIFDCCSGLARKQSISGSSISDKGKQFEIDSIAVEKGHDKIWSKNDKNPDYKLSVVHAANEGFIAKMNKIDGSYLIYQFVTKMIRNIQCAKTNPEKELYFGEIIEEIQQYLHDAGKQQIIGTFNQYTRYIKFEINKNICVETDYCRETNEMKLEEESHHDKKLLMGNTEKDTLLTYFEIEQ
eukprot:96406_1